MDRTIFDSLDLARRTVGALVFVALTILAGLLSTGSRQQTRVYMDPVVVTVDSGR